MVVVGTYKEPLLVERTFGENHPEDFIYRQLHNLLNENRTTPNLIVFLHPVLTIKPAKDTTCIIVPPQAGSDPQAGRAPQLA